MGIFTKKDTNTVTGEDKFKGWGNTKTKVFEPGRQQGAVTAAAGGDLKGKDFRELKRDVHKQKRLNRRALRKAKRKGIDPSEVKMRGGSYKELTRREQDIEQYFKAVRKERTENAAEIALTVAAVAATGGAAMGAFAPAGATAAGAGAAGAGAAGAGAGAAGVGTGLGATAGSGMAGISAGAGSGILGAGAPGVIASGGAAGAGAAGAGAAGTAAATTAGTTAATTGIKAGLKQAGKQALKNVGKDIAQGAIDNVTSGGAQGGFQPDPRVAQMEQQLAMMQNQMNFMQESAFQVPDYQPQQPFTMPPPMAQPSYTAASVYDPFLM